jgi:hypothetical protein
MKFGPKNIREVEAFVERSSNPAPAAVSNPRRSGSRRIEESMRSRIDRHLELGRASAILIECCVARGPDGCESGHAARIVGIQIRLELGRELPSDA